MLCILIPYFRIVTLFELNFSHRKIFNEALVDFYKIYHYKVVFFTISILER